MTFLPTPTITGTGPPLASVPLHRGQRWDAYCDRGIYIARVFGASEPFMSAVPGANEGKPSGVTMIANLARKDNAQATFHLAGAADGRDSVANPPSPRSLVLVLAPFLRSRPWSGRTTVC